MSALLPSGRPESTVVDAKKRIGIFGGAFDPPHKAHVALAQLALDQLALDELYVIPTGSAWHKVRALTAANCPASHTRPAAAIGSMNQPLGAGVMRASSGRIRQASHRLAAPIAVQIIKAGSEASGPNAPPVSQLGRPPRAVLLAIASPKSPPETAAPKR